MKIAIDIDNTILEHDSLLYKFANNLNSIVKPNKVLRYKELKMWERHEDKLIVKAIAKLLSLSNIKKYTVNSKLKSFIQCLSALGVEFTVLSSRPDWDCLNVIVFQALSDLGFEDEKIILECNNKVEYLKLNNISLMIDCSTKPSKYLLSAGIIVLNIDKIYDSRFLDQEKSLDK